MAKLINGIVTSKAGDKSIVVSVKTSKTHPVYRKRFTVTSKFMVHDEKNEAGLGDQVVIAETRPLSARKRFILSKISAKGGVQFRDEDATADVAELQPAAPAEKPASVAAKEEKK